MIRVEDIFSGETGADKSTAADLSSWVIWGVADNICRECRTFQYLVTNKVDSESPNDTVTICGSGLHIRHSSAFSLEESSAIKNRLNFALDQNGRLGQNLDGFTTSKTVVLEVPVGREEDVPIPGGYKSVGWIKPEEAEAVLEAYRMASGSEHLSASMSGFKTVFFDPSSSEARKFHSCVLLERVKRGSPGRRFWIRKEEADAIREAVAIRADVAFAHLHFGNGGLVQYFDEGHPAAKKYRSRTRLLRRN